MKVHIICYEDYNAWILGKIARRLHRELEVMGIDVTLGKEPDPSAMVNHHVVYFDYVQRVSGLETVMITHIDDERELNKVRRQLIDCGVEMGICMSFEAVHRLAHFGVPRDRLCFISPAHDGIMKPRKIRVGLTTRLYPDGCKREHLLEEVAEFLSAEDFTFAIMGSGWDAIVDRLRGRGFEIDYVPHFDEAAYRDLVPSLDYYLYFGRDEGSMGFLDALAAGVPTIVTPQGFHLDVPGGITHAFEDLEELRQVFLQIARVRKDRVASVASLTWAENARKHVLIWEYLLAKRAGGEVSATLGLELDGLAVVRTGTAASGSVAIARNQ